MPHRALRGLHVGPPSVGASAQLPRGLTSKGRSWDRPLWLRLGVLVSAPGRVSARRRIGAAERAHVPRLRRCGRWLWGWAFCRLGKLLQRCERLAPCRDRPLVDGRNADRKREEGLHPVRPGEQPAHVPGQFVAPWSVPGHPGSSGPQVRQRMHRPGGVRPTGENRQELDRHRNQRGVRRGRQVYARDTLRKVSKLLGRGPPVASWPVSSFVASWGRPAPGTGQMDRRTRGSSEPAARPCLTKLDHGR
jgi:hypothetical protein